MFFAWIPVSRGHHTRKSWNVNLSSADSPETSLEVETDVLGAPIEKAHSAIREVRF